MKDYKANIITALIFLLLIGSGFLVIEIRDKRAEEKVRAEEQREREIREKAEAKGNENREKVLEELDKYIKELEADENHENKITYQMGNYKKYIIEDIDYIKKIKELIESGYAYYEDKEEQISRKGLEKFKVNNITIAYYVSGSYLVGFEDKYMFIGGNTDEKVEVFYEIMNLDVEKVYD